MQNKGFFKLMGSEVHSERYSSTSGNTRKSVGGGKKRKHSNEKISVLGTLKTPAQRSGYTTVFRDLLSHLSPKED